MSVLLRETSLNAQSSSRPPTSRFPLTPAIRHGDLIFCSGQVPVVNGAIVSEEIREQTLQTLRNVQRVIEQAGGSVDTILKCTCFLREAALMPQFNAAYEEFFAGSPRFPARTTVFAALPNPAALVEIEAIAAVAAQDLGGAR
jgi:2-iminobutanoate/2-iminopropanoate deaminase